MRSTSLPKIREKIASLDWDEDLKQNIVEIFENLCEEEPDDAGGEEKRGDKG